MRKCCRHDRGSLATTPYAIHVEGEEFSVVTDGHGILAIKGPSPFPNAIGAVDMGVIQSIQKWVLSVVKNQGTMVPLADLKAWAGEAYFGEEECTRCKGDGEWPCGECGEPRSCWQCDGDGTREHPANYAFLLGVTIDRTKLARYLFPVDGPEMVRIARTGIKAKGKGNARAMAIVCDAWRLIVMPCIRVDEEAKQNPMFPLEAP